MNNLTTTDLSRIFGERIGQKVKIELNDSLRILSICAVDLANENLRLENEKYGNIFRGFDEVKLLLTPLEKISDEDCRQLVPLKSALYLHPEVFNFRKCDSKKFGFYFEWKYASSRRRRWDNVYWSDLNYSQRSFLIQQGYDVPMFFGLNHPDNGRTLIELGVAINKETLK